MSDLLVGERRRYTDLLDSLAVSPEAPERLRSAARKVDDLRYAAMHPAQDASDVTPTDPPQESAPGDAAP